MISRAERGTELKVGITGLGTPVSISSLETTQQLWINTISHLWESYRPVGWRLGLNVIKPHKECAHLVQNVTQGRLTESEDTRTWTKDKNIA